MLSSDFASAITPKASDELALSLSDFLFLLLCMCLLRAAKRPGARSENCKNTPTDTDTVTDERETNEQERAAVAALSPRPSAAPRTASEPFACTPNFTRREH
uniref:Secreted protein n=1 Tax=Steinernema glaseri TaxID=37863 RepID=A0A1I7YB43_9BILA